MFYNFFSSLNYLDIEPGVVDASLEANQMFDRVAAGNIPALDGLGQLLGADAVVLGEALSLGQTYALVYANQQAGLRARMVHCSTGQVLWELEHTLTLHEGELPLSLPSLAAAILKTAITFQQTNVLRVAAELCMQMTATIPNPPADSDIPPKIQALVHNGAGNLLTPGDVLRVVMIGDPQQKASFSLPPLLDEHVMEEKEPGVYIAAYAVQFKDRLGNGRLIGYLRAPSGASRQWVDATGPINVGTPTVLPPVIAADAVLTSERSPYLVEDALLVKPGATLVIGPGTVIWFRRLGLIVQGRLDVRGTPENPVMLSGLGLQRWKGVFLDAGDREHVLSHCRISGAEFGVRSSRSRVLVDACQFQDNGWALVAEHGALEIRDSLVRASAKTGVAVRNARLLVVGSLIAENGNGGFLLESSTVHIEGNNIVNNGGGGMRIIGEAAVVRAANNWWGDSHPVPAEVTDGSVSVEPVLRKPIPYHPAAAEIGPR
jgi:hypothetical protein